MKVFWLEGFVPVFWWMELNFVSLKDSAMPSRVFFWGGGGGCDWVFYIFEQCLLVCRAVFLICCLALGIWCWSLLVFDWGFVFVLRWRPLG